MIQSQSLTKEFLQDLLLDAWDRTKVQISEIQLQPPTSRVQNDVEDSSELTQFLSQRKDNLLNIEINIQRDELPVQTHYYIQLQQNVRVVNPTPLVYENLTPYSIVQDPYENDHEFPERIRQQIIGFQAPNTRCFDPFGQNYLSCLGEKLAQATQGYNTLKAVKQISRIIQKEAKPIVESVSEHYKQSCPQAVQWSFPSKHFFFKLTDMLCNICLLYNCSTHYQQSINFINELYPKDERERSLTVDSVYECRSKPNNPAMRQLSMSVTQSKYKCQQCGKKRSTPVKLKKFQRHWIDMLCSYGIKNPCLIAKIVNNNSFQLDCGVVSTFLESNALLLKSFAERTSSTSFSKLIKRRQPNPKYTHRDDVITPCFHDDDCDKDCPCERCFKFCCCSDTCSKRVWCECRNCEIEEQGKKICPCRQKKIECDPDMCGCPVILQDYVIPRSQKELRCWNSPITFATTPRLILAKSLICDGLGVFAGQKFAKEEFVGEYRGAILDETQSNLIEHLDQITGQHYLFVLNAEEQVDGKRMGNKTRYVNHALPPISNCDCSVISVNGNYKVQLFTKREINMGEELFFDYSDEFKTEWKSAFDKKSSQFFRGKRQQ